MILVKVKEDLENKIFKNIFVIFKFYKKNIIAKNLFSCWANWLNQNNEKIVIAPKKCLDDKSFNTYEFIPNIWIK